MDALKGLPPVIAFAAASGTGKTTLMEGVIRVLANRGLKVAALKHGHHPAEPDIPGKDSHRFRAAGAASVIFACPERWFMIQELTGTGEPPIEEHLQRLAHGHHLILVEGFHTHGIPKILIHRHGISPELSSALTHLAPILAIATDTPLPPSAYPILPLNNPEAVAEFILQRFIPHQSWDR